MLMYNAQKEVELLIEENPNIDTDTLEKALKLCAEPISFYNNHCNLSPFKIRELLSCVIHDYIYKGYTLVKHKLALESDNSSTVGETLLELIDKLHSLNMSKELWNTVYKVLMAKPLTTVTESDWIEDSIILEEGKHKGSKIQFHKRTPSIVLLDGKDIYYTEYRGFKNKYGCSVNLNSWGKITLPFNVPMQPFEIVDKEEN